MVPYFSPSWWHTPWRKVWTGQDIWRGQKQWSPYLPQSVGQRNGNTRSSQKLESFPSSSRRQLQKNHLVLLCTWFLKRENLYIVALWKHEHRALTEQQCSLKPTKDKDHTTKRRTIHKSTVASVAYTALDSSCVALLTYHAHEKLASSWPTNLKTDGTPQIIWPFNKALHLLSPGNFCRIAKRATDLYGKSWQKDNYQIF